MLEASLRALKAAALIFILLSALTVQLAAQDVETDWDDFTYDIYARGDQSFLVNLGVMFPTLFVNDGKINNSGWNPVGGSGSLMFNYYLHPYFFIGGEVGIMFANSIAGNTVFLIPLGIRLGTQFIVWRFEFPIALSFGASWHNFLNEGYFGIYGKMSLSALFRATPQWAFGLTSSWYFMPEWTGDSKKDVMGNFVDLTLSARYHF